MNFMDNGVAINLLLQNIKKYSRYAALLADKLTNFHDFHLDKT